jgi:hypothetical protein
MYLPYARELHLKSALLSFVVRVFAAMWIVISHFFSSQLPIPHHRLYRQGVLKCDSKFSVSAWHVHTWILIFTIHECTVPT